MRKIVFIAVLSLICFYCDAQRMFGISAGYVPWGIERLKSPTAGDSSYMCKWKGHYGFVNPFFKLAFERRIQSASLLFEFRFSSFSVDKISTDGVFTYNLGTYNIKQIGFSIMPGAIIMAKRRFQIPLHFGLGANYYFNTRSEPGMANNLFWNLDFAVKLKFYVSKQVAIYGGYSISGGLAFKIIERKLEPNGLGFKHYPEVGVLVNFNDKKENNKKQKNE